MDPEPPLNNLPAKSEYELARERNIKEREASLAAIEVETDHVGLIAALNEIAGMALSKPNDQPKRAAKHRIRSPRYSASHNVIATDFRRRSGRLANRTPERYIEEIDENDIPEYQPKKRRKISRSGPLAPIIPPEFITEQQLQNVALSSTKKSYSSVHGTTCHQCRQKTIDTKTVCRSGVCTGLRGQYCGPCLRGRYAEDVADALKNPKWACPCCTNTCNCSFCRARDGKRPTGILAPIAAQNGYKSVRDFLGDIEEPPIIDNACSEARQNMAASTKRLEEDDRDLLGFDKNLDYVFA